MENTPGKSMPVIEKNIRFVEPSKLYKCSDNNFFALFVSMFTDFSLF